MLFNCAGDPLTGGKILSPATGDILGTANPEIFGKLTRWMETHSGEGKSWISHIGIFDTYTQIVEARMEKKAVVRQGWRERQHELMEAGHPWVILTPRVQLAPHQLAIIRTCLAEMVGPPAWKYSKAELVLQAVDAGLGFLLQRRGVYVRRLGDLYRKRVICSKTAARPLIKAAVVPSELEYGDPDDVWDHLLDHAGYFIKDCWPTGYWKLDPKYFLKATYGAA